MISIIIPYYNASKFIEATLQSVFVQSNIDIEVIVVNDGSNKEESDFIAGLNEKYGFKLISQDNKGVGSARNRGAKAAKGNYLLFLDADDVLLPNALRNLNANVSNFVISIANYRIREKEIKPSFAPQQFILGNRIQVGSALIPKVVYEKINGFKESLSYAEDMDFWFRVWEHNINFRWVDKCVLDYRVHEQSVMRKKSPRKYLDNTKAFQYRINESKRKNLITKKDLKTIICSRLNTHHWYARESGARLMFLNYWQALKMHCPQLFLKWVKSDWRYMFS